MKLSFKTQPSIRISIMGHDIVQTDRNLPSFLRKFFLPIIKRS